MPPFPRDELTVSGAQVPGAVHGRPKETVENVTAPDDPLDVASMTREQRDALKRQILRQHPELAEQYMGIRAVE